RLLPRLGRAVGLPEDLARPLRATGARRHAVALGRAPAYRLGAQREDAGRSSQAPRAVQARWRRAEDQLPVPDAARRWRRADSFRRSTEMLRRRRLKAEDDEGLHPRGGWLPSLPDRQPE